MSGKAAAIVVGRLGGKNRVEMGDNPKAVCEVGNMSFQKTSELVHQAISYHRIVAALRTGKLAPPRKDSSGDYVWSDADVERLKKVLAETSQRTGKAVPA
jgi:hypothetical protein